MRMLGLRLPASVVGAKRSASESLQRIGSRFLHHIEMGRARRRHALETLATRLSACDPSLVVSRGYALVQLRDGALVINPAQLRPGAELKLTLAQGQAKRQVGRRPPDLMGCAGPQRARAGQPHSPAFCCATMQ